MSKNYRSELVGLFGFPVDENPTGFIMEKVFAEQGLDYRYITMLVAKENLEQAVAGLRAMNFRGVNLTIPHKVEVIQYLDELSEAAELIGAVNVIIHENGQLIGENSDGKGCLRSLQEANVTVAGKVVTILGAGGAAKAIAVECALAGANHIHIINKNPQRGQDLANLISQRTNSQSDYLSWNESISIPADTHILINATSVGLFPNVHEKPDILYSSITDKMAVLDVIFNDPNSLFLQEAKKQGAQTINGLGMLANQAEINYRLWTGQEPPKGRMEEILKEEFGLK